MGLSAREPTGAAPCLGGLAPDPDPLMHEWSPWPRLSMTRLSPHVLSGIPGSLALVGAEFGPNQA